MENLSRALMIAAEVLIGVLVLALIAAVIMIFGRFSKNVHNQMTDTQIGAFNQNFYEKDGRIDITSQEIATLINFAKSFNDSYSLPYNNSENSEYYTDIIIDGQSFFKNMDSNIYSNKKLFEDKVNEFLNENNTILYSCNLRSRAKITTKFNTKTGKFVISVDKTDTDINLNRYTKLVNKIEFYKTDIVGKNGLNEVIYNVSNKDEFEIEYN